MNAALPTPTPRTAPRPLRGLCLVGLVAAVVWLAVPGFRQLSRQEPDFEYFYKSSAWLLQHGTLDPGYDLVDGRPVWRDSLGWYLPAVARLLTLLTWLPHEAAGAVWLTLNAVAILSVLRMLGRELTGLPPTDWPVTQFAPFLLLAAAWAWELRLNQINTLTLLCLVGSFVCWARGNAFAAGFWLGWAILLKVTPGLVAVWFLLKRQTRVVAVAAGTVLLAGPVADAITLGPVTAHDAYVGWFERAVAGSSHGALVRAQREMDWRNQGLGAVASRWLHPTSYTTRFDNDPRLHGRYESDEARTLNIVHWELDTVARLVLLTHMATLGGLLWLLRKPARSLPVWRLRLEWALVVLAMLWFMPIMRRYHLVWALPALSLLAAALHYHRFRGAWTWLCFAALTAFLAIQLLLWPKPDTFTRWPEAAGVVLLSVLILATPLLVLLVRLQQRPDALPPPHFSTGVSNPAGDPRV